LAKDAAYTFKRAKLHVKTLSDLAGRLFDAGRFLFFDMRFASVRLYLTERTNLQ